MRSHGALFFYSFSTIILFSGNHFPVPCIIYQESIIYRSLYGFLSYADAAGKYRYRTISGYRIRPAEQSSHRKRTRQNLLHQEHPTVPFEEVTTDSSGRTPVIELKTPPLEYSMEPVEQQPYSEYTIQIEAEGFEPKEIAGSQVLADTLSRQPTTLNVMESGETFQRIVIPPHTLFYEYPPKIKKPR